MLRRTFTGLTAALVAAPAGVLTQTPLPPSLLSKPKEPSLSHELARDVLLIPEYSQFDWIKAERESDGAITLRGQATHKAQRAVLAELQQKYGALNLHDEIELLSNGYKDVRLRFRLYSALFGANSALLHYATRAVPPIHILVNQGRVTLKGEVALQAESALAELKARGVRGVRNLKNELRIVPGKNARSTIHASLQQH